MAAEGCYDEDGTYRPPADPDEAAWFDRQYHMIRQQRDRLSAEEYQHKLDQLCREILDREG